MTFQEVETRIRERAHGIWEREGRPADRAEAHWLMASQEVFAGKPKAAQAAARAKAARKSAPVDGPQTTPKRRAMKAKPAV